MKIQKNRAIYIGLLIIVWACAYVYIFNEKIDINGDNCRYYTFASSLASGQHHSSKNTQRAFPFRRSFVTVLFYDQTQYTR